MNELELQMKVDELSHTAPIIVNSDDDYKVAKDYLTKINGNIKEVKAYWKPLKEDAKKAHSNLCTREKEMLKPLEEAVSALKGGMNAFVAKKEEIKRKQEEIARKALEAEKARILNEIENSSNEEEKELLLAEAEIAESAQAAVNAPQIKNKGVYTDYEVIITDADKVPTFANNEEIRPIDMNALKRIAKATKGEAKIDGVEFKVVKKVRA